MSYDDERKAGDIEKASLADIQPEANGAASPTELPPLPAKPQPEAASDAQLPPEDGKVASTVKLLPEADGKPSQVILLLEADGTASHDLLTPEALGVASHIHPGQNVIALPPEPGLRNL